MRQTSFNGAERNRPNMCVLCIVVCLLLCVVSVACEYHGYAMRAKRAQKFDLVVMFIFFILRIIRRRRVECKWEEKDREREGFLFKENHGTPCMISSELTLFLEVFQVGPS